MINRTLNESTLFTCTKWTHFGILSVVLIVIGHATSKLFNRHVITILILPLGRFHLSTTDLKLTISWKREFQKVEALNELTNHSNSCTSNGWWQLINAGDWVRNNKFVLKPIFWNATCITFTGRRFWTAMTAVSLPLTATEVKLVELIALNAYSTWYTRPSGEKIVMWRSNPALLPRDILTKSSTTNEDYKANYFNGFVSCNTTR